VLHFSRLYINEGDISRHNGSTLDIYIYSVIYIYMQRLKNQSTINITDGPVVFFHTEWLTRF
jgi:hypothetical protein